MTELQTTPRPRRPRPKAVSLTDAAAARVRDIMAKADKPYVALRVGVKNGGCAGQEYTFAYAETIEPLDEVVEDKGVTILIDPKAILFLIGSEIDYETTKLASKFVFRNPNQTDACGCGESVTIIPAKALDAD
ncbi:MAG: iron-sulfur cluster assembly accessory protein [Alphaproteobacteria bacterium]|uniref:HesB/IscA family protein n=1 Tax=Brevundimonas sp. TaxID=1871086 RepID=UPI0011F5A05B|nr:iron-sulfur cluster assembly accessory protein [Brevundimonas sp.]MBU3972204.1 iron-sulfur cluster assembly accessory protein [Alphaproteobacteria bacterium]MBU4038885.1 iron-sulfur cluster assembly accessory protein [Alphaproteobacteria bacterium]MBU4136946.1 iron-sulfur cluster assembly accessory protein [Alphaproteobacteria bacterium]TAJ62113.1 MAG: iron-sulfur cluster assembly accessory protein [Brevundimonas sp.]